MPLSTAAKAALCICPPAVMAGTVATVPAVKRAVHHLTAPHHPSRPVHRVATAAVRPAAEAAVPDCEPGMAGPLPAVPLVTYAAPIPDEPAGAQGDGLPGQGGAGQGVPGTTAPLAAQPPIAAAGLTPAVPATPAVPVTPDVPGTPVVNNPPVTSAPAVPEPASWLMMIVGAGALGTMVRRRRGAGRARSGRPAVAGAAFWAGSTAEAGDLAATTALQGGAAKSALASVAGKAMLCVCPAVVAAGSVVAVPPLRHAVHAATMPAPAPLARPRGVLCNPVTVPVAATAVKGFPDTVTTAVRPS